MPQLHLASLSASSLPHLLFLGAVLLGPVALWLPTLHGCRRFFAALETQDRLKQKRQPLRLSATDR